MKTLLFVDDEPRILQGMQRQLRPLRDEWDMHFAAGGAQALEFMAGTPVDVLVSDMKMPHMDGAELLTQVMQRYPHTIRLVLSGHADREAVLRLVGPAHQYLSKPCEPEELRSAINRSLAMRQVLDNDQLKQLVSRIDCLPSLPAQHQQLTDELRKEDPSVEVVSEIISRDAGMATKVLQLVNSAFFGLPQEITNISEAVIYLGLGTIRSLALSVQVFSQFDPRTLKQFPIDAIAHHCWMTGIVARRIAEAEHCEPKMDDQSFLGGLVHDIGYLILAAGVPDQYSAILQSARDSGRPVWELEQAHLGASHAEVGAYLLGLWGLPMPAIEAVALHHRPSASASRCFSPVTAVHVADVFMHAREPGQIEQVGLELDLPHLAALGLADHIDGWKQRCFPDSD